MCGASIKPYHPRCVAQGVLSHIKGGGTGVSEMVLVMNESSMVTNSYFDIVNINTPILCLCSARSVLVRAGV